MRYRARRTFQSIHLGNFQQGQALPVVSEHLAMQLMKAGLIEAVEDLPAKKFQCGETAGIPSLSSPADPLSLQSNVDLSQISEMSGDAGLSQSTAAGEPSPAATCSTPVTATGGSDTTKKRRGRPKGGQQTRGAQKNTD